MKNVMLKFFLGVLALQLSACNSVSVDEIAKLQDRYDGFVAYGTTIHALCSDKDSKVYYKSRKCKDAKCAIIENIKNQCSNSGWYIANMDTIKTGSMNQHRRQNLIKYSNRKSYAERKGRFYLNNSEIHRVIKDYHLEKSAKK